MTITPLIPSSPRTPGEPLIPEALMDARATAAFLGVSVLSLADWRTKGIGPSYMKVGRCVRYRLSALEAWLQSRTRKGA